MTKSELIKALQHSIEVWGDDEVYVQDGDSPSKYPTNCPSVEIKHEKVHSELHECVLVFKL